MKYLLVLLVSVSFSSAYAQLAAKFPAAIAGYQPVGKPECTSLNMAGVPPMNSCEQKYKNGNLVITVSITEYPKGNPTLTTYGGDQGDDTQLTKSEYTQEALVVGKAKGSATYMKKTHMSNASLQIGDKMTIDIAGPNQPNAEVVKAFAKALKL